MRLHPSVIALQDRIRNGPKNKIYDIDLSYLTSRGNWYHISWKGDVAKSGGIATNIGIHFFDMLIWIFGGVKSNEVYAMAPDHAAGFLQLENARVRWFLSINYDHIPDVPKAAGKRTYRSLMIEQEEIEFSEGFTDLHRASYQRILGGQGFGLTDAETSIKLVHDIRNSVLQRPNASKDKLHPFIVN